MAKAVLGTWFGTWNSNLKSYLVHMSGVHFFAQIVKDIVHTVVFTSVLLQLILEVWRVRVEVTEWVEIFLELNLISRALLVSVTKATDAKII